MVLKIEEVSAMRNVWKRVLVMTMTASLVLTGMPGRENRARAAGEGETKEVQQVELQTASGRDENYVKELDGTWYFGGKNATQASALSANYANWQKVTLPHTWNAADGEDGGGNYVRAAYWYHKEIQVEDAADTQKRYLEFLGSNQKTDVYVNGTKAGTTHKGGYTAFRYDVTGLLKKGTNRVDVRVDNTYDQTIAPISGDFNMYGGLYRRVYLVTVNPVHVDLDQNGSSGLFLTTGTMRSQKKPADLGKFQAQTTLVNDSDGEKTVDVTVSIKGKNAPGAETEQVTIPAHGKYQYTKECQVENPVLWEGAHYDKDQKDSEIGYRYQVNVTVKDGGQILDEVSDKIGFRYFWIDSSNQGESGEGFFLNGKKFPLRGVNRHSFLAKVGSAMTEEQHAKDMEIMKELGVNAVRLCHYPQTDYFYDLCDENGIIVWTEIPVVNEIRNTDEFKKTTKQQLTELISQQYNRPSVCFWGIENEIGNGQSLTNATANDNLASAKKLLYELDGLAKELDPTGRYTTQAVNRDYSMNNNDPDSVNKDFENNKGWKSDVVAWNIYPGWYPDANFYGTFEDVMKRKGALDSRAMGISEYGWGANVNQHEEDPALGVNGLSSGGSWHPEEYQNKMNEEAIAYLNTHDELWGTFYWALFDFAVDSRNEGSQVALNDKGLVTADRQTKKDSFYLYKANWNKKDLFTYITSRRFVKRDDSVSTIKVYSNCDEVELFLNGTSMGKMDAKGNGIFVKEGVKLPFGDIEVKAAGTCDGDETVYTDQCQWTRELCKKADLKSDVFPVDTTQKTIVVENNVTLKQFREKVTGVNNGVYKVYDGETELTEEDAKILPGIRIHVVAEDGVTESDYTVISSNLCIQKKVTASSVQTGNEAEHAVDGNSASKWVAVNGTYPQDITVDLGKSYYLGNVTIDWDYRNGARFYGYAISVSQDGKEFTEVVDQRKNKKAESQKDSMLLSKARYIKVTATGCNQAGWASIYEIKADGYAMESDAYEVDEKHQLILLDEFPETGLAEGTFSGHIKVTGNYDYRINLSSGWIKEGNTIDILDEQGKVVTQWTICAKANAANYYKEIPVEKVALNETEKSLAVNGTFALKATVLPLTASDQTVTFKSSDESVATVSKDGTVTAHKVGTAVITAYAGNNRTAACVVTVKDYSKIQPVVTLGFDGAEEVSLFKEAALVPDPDDAGNQVLRIDETAGGTNGNYAIAKADLSSMDFSKGVTVSMKVRPTANSGDWNYLFAIGQTQSSGTYNYCDGTIGFIARHGDPYEAHFPGDGWADGNTVDSNYSYFQSKEHGDKWYRLTYVYSTTETCIYVDGVLACRWSESGSIASVLKALNKGHLVLGAGASEGNYENMGGYLDDVYVYDEALDANSIPYIGKKADHEPEQPIKDTHRPSGEKKQDTTGNKASTVQGSSQQKKTVAAKKETVSALDKGLSVQESKGKLKVRWGKVTGAKSYAIYVQKAGSKKMVKAKTVSGKKTKAVITKLLKEKISSRGIYKVKIVSYDKNNKKLTVSRNCTVAGSKHKKYTNIKRVKAKKKSIVLKRGKKTKLALKVTKAKKSKKLLPSSYGHPLMYKTTDKSVASVSSAGVIGGKKAGTCKVQIFTQSGFAGEIKVKVK